MKSWNLQAMGLRGRQAGEPAAPGSRRRFRLWLVVAACVLVPAMRLGAEDFGTTKTFDTRTADGEDSEDHRLNDAGTEITVTGDGTYSYTLNGVISGTGDLIKTGAGSLILQNGFNTYTGGTIVNGGTLKIISQGNTNRDSLYAVHGSGSVLEAAVLELGHSGSGNLIITDGGEARATGQISLGINENSHGILSVSGNGSHFTTSDSLYVGKGGSGLVTVTSGAGSEISQSVIIGDRGGSGTVTVNGSLSEFTTSRAIYVGENGKGFLNILNGGSVTVGMTGSISNSASGNGSVTVAGSGSTLEVNSSLAVGNRGTGYLKIADGGEVTVGSLSLSAKQTAPKAR